MGGSDCSSSSSISVSTSSLVPTYPLTWGTSSSLPRSTPCLLETTPAATSKYLIFVPRKNVCSLHLLFQPSPSRSFNPCTSLQCHLIRFSLAHKFPQLSLTQHQPSITASPSIGSEFGVGRGTRSGSSSDRSEMVCSRRAFSWR